MSTSESLTDPEELFEILEQLGQGLGRTKKKKMPDKKCFDKLFSTSKQKGSFGNVYKAIYLPTSTQVALKILRADSTSNTQVLKAEISLLSHIRSQYVVKMFGSYLKGSNLWM